MRFAPLSLAAVLSVSSFAFPGGGRAMADQAGKSAAASPAAPAGVTLAEINDRRAESFARVRLSFVVPDLVASEVRGQRVLLKEATDDKGVSLVPEGAAGAKMEENRGALAIGAEKEPAKFDVELKSPSRSAKLLKVVSGQVELYAPGRDPAASVTISKLDTRTDSPLSEQVLKANGVKIVVLSAKGVEAERKAAGDAARKAARERGLGAEDVESEGAWAQKGRLSTYDPKYHTILKVEDPGDRIGSYAWVDPAGRESAASAYPFEGYMFLSNGLNGPPGPDWSLRIQVRTPKNVVIRPFTLKDVPLP